MCRIANCMTMGECSRKISHICMCTERLVSATHLLDPHMTPFPIPFYTTQKASSSNGSRHGCCMMNRPKEPEGKVGRKSRATQAILVQLRKDVLKAVIIHLFRQALDCNNEQGSLLRMIFERKATLAFSA